MITLLSIKTILLMIFNILKILNDEPLTLLLENNVVNVMLMKELKSLKYDIILTNCIDYTQEKCC